MSSHGDHPTRSRGRDPSLPALLGDWLCLDFANTVNDRTGKNPRDTLAGYADLARWAWHAALVTGTERDHLFAAAEARPTAASSVFAGAIALREAVYRVFVAIAAGANPARADLATIQQAHLTALGHAHLARGTGSFEWVWDEPPALDRMLWPIATSAVALLTSDRLHRVKQCPGCDDCGWLFLDVSKNATRRWCSMDDCGSRAKMRRQYARRKGVV
ncbi:MAG TPA: ABATE domain-containing protein [Thermomicrobiales bacterium]|jgi:predicted RNA-binding Zn ribbon-like protein